MRVSERRSPTFPQRLAAGRACVGGSPLSHDLSGSCAHLGAIHFLPENSLPLQLQGGGYKGMGRRGEEAEQFGFKMSPGLSTASRGLKS